MEVIIQEVKTEPVVPDWEDPQRPAFSFSPVNPGGEPLGQNHHHYSLHSGTEYNNNLISHCGSRRNARDLIVSSNSSSHHPYSVVAHSQNGTTASIVSNSTPVRTTSLTGQRLQTMAKSSGLSIVHVTLPQTVIQSPSVIQSAAGQLQLSKGNVILVSSKPNSSVIQTTSGAIQTVQVLENPHSDDSLSNDATEHSDHIGRSSDRKRREILTRRPSYRKILSDLGGAEISGEKVESPSSSESSQDAEGSGLIIGGTQYPPGVVKVINANALGLGQVTTAADASSVPATSLQTITMTNAGTAGGTIVQYAQSQDGQFFVPGKHHSLFGSELQAYTIRPVSSASSSPNVVVGGGHHVPEEATRKREIRLLKNREAARECRRKKKEYIKCLENRVAVLENQNKALIDELKSLKELYCQQKTE